MQIDLMERHFTKSLALDLMGSKEKWASGQGGATDKFITDFMPRYILGIALCYNIVFNILGKGSAIRGLRYMTEGGIEGVPNFEAGNYVESTEHTKYSQSVCCLPGQARSRKRMCWS